MKYSELIEKEPHGTSDFPIEFYRLDHTHPRYVMALHWHPEMELIRVRTGTFELHLNRQSYRLSAGDIAIVNPGILHRGDPQDCQYDCAVFKLDMLCPGSGNTINGYIKPLVGGQQTAKEYLPARSAPQIEAAVERLFSFHRECAEPYELAVYSAMYELFYALYRSQAIEKHITNKAQAKQLGHLTELLEWINAHYTERITLADLSKAAGINEKYLCRFFKEYTSYTPIEYINRLRVEKAADDMRLSHVSVTDAAYANGFNDSAYFCKIFRQIMGVSPNQYRKACL